MNAPMLERSGRIVALDARQLTVRFEAASACGACRAAKVCAGSAPTRDLVVPRPAGAFATGDRIYVGLREDAAMRAAALAYLAPLAGLGIALVAAALAGLPDDAIALASFAGLGVGFAAVRVLARRAAPRLQPSVIGGAQFFNSPHEELENLR